MSGLRDSDFASTSASGLSQRHRVAADAPFYDAPIPSRVNRLADCATDSIRDGISDFVDASTISSSNDRDPSVSELQNVIMNRQGDDDAGVSAFTAVSQYPSAIDNGPNLFPTSEVVNAVMEREESFHRRSSTDQQIADMGPSSSTDLYMSDSEMDDALGDLSAPEPAAGGDVDMEAIARQLIRSSAIQRNVSTIEQDVDEAGNDLLFEYGSAMLRDLSLPSTPREDDPDDTRKFYLDDGDDVGYAECPQFCEWGSQVSDVDFDDFYRGFDYDSVSQMTDTPVPSGQDDVNLISEGEGAADEGLNDFAHIHASEIHRTTLEKNLTIDEFIQQWLAQSTLAFPNLLPVRTPSPSRPLSTILCWAPPETVMRPKGYPGDFYDIQQIPWWGTLRVKRSDARALRDVWYTSYHNLDYLPHRNSKRIPREEFHFREKSMHTKYKATIEHFQLRNLMSVASCDTVHFAEESKLYSWIPGYDELDCLIDLSKPRPESYFSGPVKISSMKSAHDVSIAGGFYGEYAMRAAGMEGRVEGRVTDDHNGITNHVDIIQHRTNRSPMGIFASNDKHLRTLDCETNTFVADHKLSRAINCTSTSHDGRLRVVIGDSPDAWVIEADTGKPVHPLRGHRDFGFACAWSPDMRHIATSNQDKTAIIWDARTWRILETIESDVAGYRSVRYSPVGGGPRTLLLSEPADRIAIVNAQTYQTRQVHDFFGEIGGADYSPDGSVIWVANTDHHFGGFMEFERRQWGQRYGIRELPNEWLPDSELDDDERCVLSAREREMRALWNLDDEEHGDIIG